MLKRLLPALFCLAAAAAAQGLSFIDLVNGDLITQGTKVHVTLSAHASRAALPTVQFFFTPEPGGAATPVGTDAVGIVPDFGPGCENCTRQGVYTLTVDEKMQHLHSGWGRLSARISTHRQDDAFVRIYLQFLPGNAIFSQPLFQQPLPTNGKFPVALMSQADGIADLQVGWQLVNAGARNVNPFEQHVLGKALTPNGNASCVPTTVAANLAWLNDTSQWTTIPNSFGNMCQGSRDYCLVTFLGTLMGTGVGGGGTSGGGADQGLVDYLKTFGYQKGVDYGLLHDPPHVPGIPKTVPEYLLSHFASGHMISVGLHNQPGNPSFGHFLVVDDIVVAPNGSAMIRLMDPYTVANPPTVGIYRWMNLYPDGTVDWASATPAPGYGLNNGPLVIDESQIVFGFSFFNFGPNLPASQAPVSASTPVPTTGQVTVRRTGNGHWTGEFAPPSGSPGPWLLVSQITLESGHKLFDYKYVTGPGEVAR